MADCKPNNRICVKILLTLVKLTTCISPTVQIRMVHCQPQVDFGNSQYSCVNACFLDLIRYVPWTSRLFDGVIIIVICTYKISLLSI